MFWRQFFILTYVAERDNYGKKPGLHWWRILCFQPESIAPPHSTRSFKLRKLLFLFWILYVAPEGSDASCGCQIILATNSDQPLTVPIIYLRQNNTFSHRPSVKSLRILKGVLIWIPPKRTYLQLPFNENQLLEGQNVVTNKFFW